MPDSPPLVSVFTPVHNKGEFAAQAIRSVLAQDFADFEYWILENSTDGRTRDIIAPLLGDPRIRYEEIDLTPEDRAAGYVTAMLLNRYYPKAAGEYILYLSDDDLFDPETFRLVTEFLSASPGRHVCWFGLRIAEDYGDGPRYSGAGIRAAWAAGAGTGMPVVDCRIDGGQVAHRVSCLEALGPPPWFPETREPHLARHADGLFLQALADRFVFWPLDADLMTHRRTPLSTWDRV